MQGLGFAVTKCTLEASGVEPVVALNLGVVGSGSLQMGVATGEKALMALYVDVILVAMGFECWGCSTRSWDCFCVNNEQICNGRTLDVNVGCGLPHHQSLVVGGCATSTSPNANPLVGIWTQKGWCFL